MGTTSPARPRWLTDGEGVLAALRDGDEDAFAALVRRERPRMSALARSLTPDRSAAERVVRAAWLRVIGRLDETEDDADLHAAILRAVVEASADAREVPVAGPLPSASRAGTGGPWVTPPRPWGDGFPAGGLDDRARGILAGAVDALPPAVRAVVRLRDVEGWSPEDVGEALDMPAGDQRALLNAGRAALRAALDDVWRGGADG